MLYKQIYYHIRKFIPEIVNLKRQDWSMSQANYPQKPLTTQLQNDNFLNSLLWLEREGYIDIDKNMDSTPLLWKYFDNQGNLRLTLKWKIFIQNYERKWCGFIPVGSTEFFAKDFPFISGALVFIGWTALIEIFPFVLSFLKKFFFNFLESLIF